MGDKSVLDMDSCKECNHQGQAIQCCKTCVYAHRLEVDSIRTELKEAREDGETLRTIALGWEKANETLRGRVKELDTKLFLEGVKNNSNVARVEFLEEKWSEWTEPDPAWFDMSFQEHANIMKSGREKAEADLATTLNIADAWEKANETIRVRLKELDKKLFLEGVKNNSDVARVEFLEEKVKELEKGAHNWRLTAIRITDQLSKAEADSKRLIKTMSHVVDSIELTPHMDAGEMSTLVYLMKQALIDTEGEKGGA
jgi:hypothetical protein